MHERRRPHDPTYAEWHRVASIARFMSVSEAKSLSYSDADYIESCQTCFSPLLLVEAKYDRGQRDAFTGFLQALAERAQVPAVLVFYTLSTTRRQPPPRDDLFDIDRFRVQAIWNPRLGADAPTGPNAELIYTPEEWASILLLMRRRHDREEHIS